MCSGLARSLSRKKIQTTIFLRCTRADCKLEAQKINEFLDVIRLPMIDYPPRSLWFYFRSAKLLRLLEDYDIIHGVSPEMAINYTLYRGNARNPLITTLHGSHRAALKAFLQSPMRDWVTSDFAFHVLELPLHEIIAKRCLDKSSRVVVCSYTTLGELKTFEKADSSKISVIYNGIDFSEIQQKESGIIDEREDKDYEYSIMFAGRLFWMKGLPFVLRAYENLERQFKGLHLKIFGKGPLENEIRKFMANRNLKSSVYFGGFLPHKELIKEIKKSDIVVFPSLYEAQPMFALETMACRKPLVAFDLPYAREIIRNGHNGLLAKAYDVNDLSNKIALAIEDRKLGLEIGRNAYAYVRRNHDWNVQAEKYLRVYEEASISD